MGAIGRKQSLALLEAAFDAGIRHFDVARAYGFGEAESCLGDFLAKHRGDVTVTTKFGLAAAKNQPLLRAARGLAGPILRRLPGLKRGLARGADKLAGSGTRVQFSVEEARRSLDDSLSALRTDRIDVWLLHEAQASELTDDRLRRFLEDAVAGGKIGSFGVGSEAIRIPALLAERREYCRVLQFEWNVLSAAIPADTASWQGIFRIHHRALTPNLRPMHQALVAEPERTARWSRIVGMDLRKTSVLAALMLGASLQRNPGSVVLFSSKRAEHIRDNVRIAEDTTLREPALRFHELMQAEGTPEAGAK